MPFKPAILGVHLDPLFPSPGIALAQLAAGIDPASFDRFVMRGH
jgi:pyruvate formate lyase activating enzyme